MELSDLRIFQAIAEESSISGAAKRLDYVQSNVTSRLRKLEDELGVLLFYRNVKGIRLTEKGALFRKYADSIIQMADEAIAVLQDQDNPAGTLRIGVVETVTCGNFMNLISTYQTQYEQVTLRLETGNPSALMEKVKNFGQNTPIGRAGQPAELAPAYVLLASQESSYMTGALIEVTGGRPMI